MFSKFRFILFLAIALPCVFVSCDKDDDEEPYDVVVDFQNATFPDGLKYNNNSGDAGKFTEGIVSFPNSFSTSDWGDYWSGFAYSQMHDMTTEGLDNQYSVYVANEPENKFVVTFVSDPTDYSTKTSITFGQPVKNLSFDVANATYAALSMKNGDSFGGKKFTDSDWFELTITATNSKNEQLTPQTFKLADGVKIVDAWKTIDIVGEGIVKLQFSLTSTDNDPQYGMKTPAYFCIDNIKARIVK